MMQFPDEDDDGDEFEKFDLQFFGELIVMILIIGAAIRMFH
jgi:hypothetical protein